ncbi:hypothetical protein [Pontibacter russatus]|uniref:hypothetical protein n=1 Tax=Pontibacter russatus TaxID=2694929 RepID=UPI001F476E1A|nr:hypothetical protein [Pontibacter russatus]
MMTNYNLTWQETDARFLEALLLATGGEGGATLSDVLLMADAVDGTVFTLKEVEQALEKLVAIGYVSVQKNKIYLSALFLKDYGDIAGEGNEQEALLQLLQPKALTAQGIAEAQNLLKRYKLRNHYQQYTEQYGG